MTTEEPPLLVMLCGIPTSGKTTFLTKNLYESDTCKDFVTLSTDNYIELEALKQGSTYDELFESLVDKASAKLELDLKSAIKRNANIVWDQTNLTPKTRRRKLSKIPTHYNKIAVWFEVSLEEALERNKQRNGKLIPESVLKSMYSCFTPPTKEEGFDSIISPEHSFYLLNDNVCY